MKALFWLSASCIFYVYVGYPLALAAWTRLARRPLAARKVDDDSALPAVSVLLAVRNEAPRLAARLDNLLALDYPRDRLEIVVVSNGSNDGTSTVLAPYADRVVSIALHAPGKAGALNVAVAAASHDVLVFADARQRFAPDALRRLVEPLADPAVAGVTGELVIDTERARVDEASPVGEGVGLYWRYEKWLRRNESAVHSVLGATGAIYALRRSAWTPLPLDTLIDDVLAPMRAVLAGGRIVFAPDARAFDQASPDAATEGRRKRRTLAGNYQLLWLEPRLLLPVVNPVWVQFVSHKVGRLLVPYALLALLAANVSLASSSVLYGATLALQVAFYLLAAHGAVIAADASRADIVCAAASNDGRGAGPSGVRSLRKELASAQAD